ncbi:hypothetical protein HDU93_009020 [Gonapodya sp. JEL0774]|nr:hypothetical protein HDU93_009020 [Gonapodya sp. JEL0774]
MTSTTAITARVKQALAKYTIQDPLTGISFLNLGASGAPPFHKSSSSPSRGSGSEKLAKWWFSDPDVAIPVLCALSFYSSPVEYAPGFKNAERTWEEILKARGDDSATMDRELRKSGRRSNRASKPMGTDVTSGLDAPSPHIITLRNAAFVPPQFHRNGPGNWLVGRQPPPQHLFRKPPLRVLTHIDPEKPTEVMWDNRFLVSVRRPDHVPASYTFHGVDPRDIPLVVRQFTQVDYRNCVARCQMAVGWDDRIRSALAAGMEDGSSSDEYRELALANPPPRPTHPDSLAPYARLFHNSLLHFVRACPVILRPSIPCVAILQDNGDESHVVAVPSLGIVLERGLCEVDVVYVKEKLVDEYGLEESVWWNPRRDEKRTVNAAELSSEL